nr:MAG TPA: hypothetical protein [Caudoviricetes sp.]
MIILVIIIIIIKNKTKYSIVSPPFLLGILTKEPSP